MGMAVMEVPIAAVFIANAQGGMRMLEVAALDVNVRGDSEPGAVCEPSRRGFEHEEPRVVVLADFDQSVPDGK